MRMADRERVFELAAQQLPTAALYGIGGELVRLTEALDAKERLVRLAVASDGRSFGVLALTIRRVLWVPSSEPDSDALFWPRHQVHPAAGKRGGCLSVDTGEEAWEFRRILPTNAVEELIDQLVGDLPGSNQTLTRV